MEQSIEQVKLHGNINTADAHGLAECHLSEIRTLVSIVKQNIDSEQVSLYQELLGLTEKLAKNYAKYHKDQREEYEAKFNT